MHKQVQDKNSFSGSFYQLHKNSLTALIKIYCYFFMKRCMKRDFRLISHWLVCLLNSSLEFMVIVAYFQVTAAS